MRFFGKHLNNCKSISKSLKFSTKNQTHHEKPILSQKRQDASINSSFQQNYEKMISLQTLESQQVTRTFSYTIQTLNMREKLFKWLIAQCRLTLELKRQTIEHCMQLFDKYYSKVGSLPNNLSQGQLSLISCLFISSKVQEVYPPVLADFQYVSKYKFGGRDILDREIEILQILNFEIMLALASSYSCLLFGETVPDWGIICYANLPITTTMKSLAIEIQEVKNLFDKAGDKKKRQQDFLKMAELVIKNLQLEQ